MDAMKNSTLSPSYSHRRFSPPEMQKNQRGVVMILVLISLIVLLLAGVGLIYSSDTALLSAGNLAFKRDATNQSERAVNLVRSKFIGSGVLTSASGDQSVPAQNFSAVALASNSLGIPTILLNDTAFTSTFTAGDIVDSTSNVTVRYVVDRMCSAVGEATDAICSRWSGQPSSGTDTLATKKVESIIPVYRISILVTGPKKTQNFIQATMRRDL